MIEKILRPCHFDVHSLHRYARSLSGQPSLIITRLILQYSRRALRLRVLCYREGAHAAQKCINAFIIVSTNLFMVSLQDGLALELSAFCRAGLSMIIFIDRLFNCLRDEAMKGMVLRRIMAALI